MILSTSFVRDQLANPVVWDLRVFRVWRENLDLLVLRDLQVLLGTPSL